jgi:hypothetical protein
MSLIVSKDEKDVDIDKNKDKQTTVITGEKDYAWKREQEVILKKWADKALCFKMMHERAQRRFWCLNAWYNIPVIILSTITGAGNLGTESFSKYVPYLPYLIGGINIFAGIVATIATYTGVAQKLEAHKFACISWDKYSRKIQIELAKSRKDRVKAKDFIKQAAEDYDRLIEMSPILPNDIIRWFSNMIETGEFEEEIGECAQCCYECFCFPCGCSYCKCFDIFCCTCCKTNNKSQDQIEEDKLVKASWKLIELPEVIGRIKPTEIASEPIPETPPPLIIVETKKEEKTNIKKDDVNLYDIYNLGASDTIV